MFINHKGKSGYILLEVMAFMAFILVLIAAYSKITLLNLQKAEIYFTEEDLYYINDEQKQFLNVVEEEINNNSEILEKLKEEDTRNEVSYSKTYDLNSKVSFVIKNGKAFIIQIINKDTVYREIKMKIEEDNKLQLIPDKYKAYNIEL